MLARMDSEDPNKEKVSFFLLFLFSDVCSGLIFFKTEFIFSKKVNSDIKT